VGGFHATQLQRHSSPQLRNVCFLASMDEHLSNPKNALVRPAATASGTASTTDATAASTSAAFGQGSCRRHHLCATGIWQPPSASTEAAHFGVGQRFLPGHRAHVALTEHTLAGPCQHRSTALSLAVSTPVSLRPSASSSSHARLQPQSLIGYAAFGKL